MPENPRSDGDCNSPLDGAYNPWGEPKPRADATGRASDFQRYGEKRYPFPL